MSLKCVCVGVGWGTGGFVGGLWYVTELNSSRSELNEEQITGGVFSSSPSSALASAAPPRVGLESKMRLNVRVFIAIMS